MSSRNTSSSEGEPEAAPNASKKTTQPAATKKPVDDDEMPGLVPTTKARTASGKTNTSAQDTTMVDGDTDVEDSDTFDSLDGDSCVGDDIALPEDYIHCSGCANRLLRETEARLDVTELELTEAQTKIVKLEVQRDAAIALQATLKTELQLAEQAKMTEALTASPVPLAETQRRQLESRLHESEERFLTLLSGVHRALRSTKAPRGEKTAAEVVAMVRDMLDATVKHAMASP
jgi:hypothetical protein